MAKTNITEFSNVASNNTDINNVNIDENCPASNLNNALRELMKALKDVDTGSQALTALSVAGSVTATTSLKTPLIEFTDGDNALTIADGGNVTANANLTVSGDLIASSLNGGQFGGRRNIVINGAMQVAQRGDVTGITGESYGGPDRFELVASNIGTFTVSQSSTAPTGFKNSYKVDCTTADASLGSEDLLRVAYRIEGQDLQQLAYGTSSANTITLSFYVRSNKAGTYNIQFQQADNSSKQAVVSYTISSANTWEFKTIIVQGDTSGVINDDNGEGLILFWVLGAGSLFTSGSERSTYTAFSNGDVAPTQTVNLADNTANEWMITGVQLEVGSQSTPFEHQSIGETLALAQRYYEVIDRVYPHVYYTNVSIANFFYVTKRATASITADTNPASLDLNVVGTTMGYIYKSGTQTSPPTNIRLDAEL